MNTDVKHGGPILRQSKTGALKFLYISQAIHPGELKVAKHQTNSTHCYYLAKSEKCGPICKQQTLPKVIQSQVYNLAQLDMSCCKDHVYVYHMCKL